MTRYLKVARQVFIEGLTYRGYYIASFISQIIYYFVLYFLWSAIYAGSSGTLNGLTFTNAFVSLVLTTALYTTMDTGQEWFMSHQMQSGDIIIPLVKPMHFMAYVFFVKLGDIISVSIIKLIPVFTVMAILFPEQFYVNWNIIFFILCCCFSIIILFCIEFAVGVISFYTQSIWGVSILKSLVIGFFAGTTVPLAFFPKTLEKIGNILPFKQMYYKPLEMITNPSLGVMDYLKTLGLLAVWSFIMFFIACGMYRIMKKKIVINGG